MSARNGHRSTWASRLGSVLFLGAYIAFAVVIYRLTGGLPHLPRLTTWAAFTGFLKSSDDVGLINIVLLNAQRLFWVVWAYLAILFLGTIAASISERLGRPSVRAAWERIQPRSAIAAANVVLALVLTAPRLGQGVAAAATLAPASAPERPHPAGGSPPPVQVSTPLPGRHVAQQGVREHVVRRGESLYTIAEEECGTPLLWREMADLNHIEHPDLIFADSTLKLPPACQATHLTYVVEERDTLTKIAQSEYGTATAATAIWQENKGATMSDGRKFDDPNKIHAGWTMRLPTQIVGLTRPASQSPAGAAAPSPPAAPTPTPAWTSAPGTALPAVPVAPELPALQAPVTVTPASSPSPVVGTPTPAPGALQGEAPAAGTGGVVAPAASPSATATASQHPLALKGPQATQHTPPGRGRGVRVPGDAYIPATAAAGLLALWLRARAQRLRRWSSRDVGPEPLPGPVTQALSRAETVPALDLLGPLTHRLIEIWRAHTAQVPRILAAWEQGESVRFLLSGEGTVPVDSVDDETGIQVRFHPTASVSATRDRGTEGSSELSLLPDRQAMWAVATGPRLAVTRRGIWAYSDGLLVPVAERPSQEEGAAESASVGWLHLPLLGAPLAISGSDAGSVAEALVVAAALRPREGELRLVAVGDVLMGLEIPEGIDLPPVERLTSRKKSAALRHQLEEQLAARRESFAARGIKTFAEWAALVPDDRFDAWILVLDAEKATEWSDLLEQGADLGIAALVLGGDAPCVSRRLVAEGGALRAEIPEVGDLAGLIPFVLPEGALEEVADIARGPAEEDEALADAPMLSSGAPAAEAVRLFVLGGLRLEAAGRDDEAAFKPKRAKSRELIAYLAYMAVHDRDDDGWVSKGSLCNVLWPRAEASYLDVCLADARKWLEGPRRSGATASLIQQADGKYRLDRQRVWIDLEAFEAKVQEARGSADPEQTLREALALYRGDLLDSQELGERERFSWVQDLGFRINVRKLYHWALAQLSDVLQATGRPAEALEFLEPALRRSLCEELECKAMACEGELQPRGLADRQAVMQRWERLCARLEKDLGADPVPSTCEAYGEVLRQTERSSSGTTRGRSHRPQGASGAGVRLVTPFVDEATAGRNGFGG